MAESYFTELVRREGLSAKFVIGSAATHTDALGHAPHRGTREKLAQEGIPLVPHRARLLTRADGEAYDYILGMDAVTEEGEFLGKVADITPLSTEVYTLEKEGRRILFPAVSGVIVRVDKERGQIVVDKKRFDEVAVF